MSYYKFVWQKLLQRRYYLLKPDPKEPYQWHYQTFDSIKDAYYARQSIDEIVVNTNANLPPRLSHYVISYKLRRLISLKGNE